MNDGISIMPLPHFNEAVCDKANLWLWTIRCVITIWFIMITRIIAVAVVVIATAIIAVSVKMAISMASSFSTDLS